MAVLISGSDGNFTDAASWRLVDATSFWDRPSAGASGVGTSYSYSAAFIPGAITIDAIAIRVSNVNVAAPGTFTLALQNQTDVAFVEEITVNVADFVHATTVSRFSWYLFKLSTPATLIAGKSYRIGLKVSSAGSVTVWYEGSAANWFRMLRTTTTQAPAADDTLHVLGEFGPYSSGACSVVMNNTALTTFGTLVAYGQQGIAVGYNGTLNWGTAASTAYYLRFRNIFRITEGGVVNIGTSGTPIPATSSATLDMVNAAAGDSGIEVRHGTFNIYGNSRGNTVTRLARSVGGWCKTEGTAVTALTGSQSFVGLTGSIVIAGSSYTISSVTDATHLTLTGSAGNLAAAFWKHLGTSANVQVDSTEGWGTGDVLCFGPSIVKLDETGTISTVSNGSELVLSGGLGNMHYGAEPMRVPVGLLSHNVRIRGSNRTLVGYVYLAETASSTWRNAEFQWLGRNSAGEDGIACDLTTGYLDMQHCTVRDCTVAGAEMVKFYKDAATATVSHNVFYNGLSGISNAVDITGTHRYERNFMCAMSGGNGLNYRAWTSASCIGNFVASAGAAIFTDTCANSGSISACEVFCGTTAGLHVNDNLATADRPIWTFEGCKAVCCPTGFSGTAPSGEGMGSAVLSNCTFVACNRAILFGDDTLGYTLTARNCTAYKPFYVAYDMLSLATPLYGASLQFNNCTFKGTEAERTYDYAEGLVAYSSSWAGALGFSNCQLPASCDWFRELNTATNDLSETRKGVVNVQRLNGTVGVNAHYDCNGTALADAVIYSGPTPPSVRLTPEPGSILQGAWINAVVSNGNSVTVTVQARESVAGDGASYDGKRPELWVAQNAAAGVNADTLLAVATSAGSGTWATLSGAVGPVTDNAVLRFYASVGGTACTQGWVNVDTATFSADTNAAAFAYWDVEGETFAANIYSVAGAGGGGGGGAWTYIG